MNKKDNEVNDMRLSNELDELLKAELNENQKDMLIENSVYFGRGYNLLNFLIKNNLARTFSKELHSVRGHPSWIKMYSIASSARLCCLYFKDKNVVFEKQLKIAEGKDMNGKPYSVFANYDAFDEKENIYYECKCHEIATNSHGSYLKKWAYEPILAKLNFNNIKTEKEYLIPSLKDFGISIDGYNEESSIYNMYFDCKQLVTHFSGFIEQNKQGILFYVFFKPDEDYIDKNQRIQNLYDTLEKELISIKKSELVKRMEKRGVKFDYRFVPFSKVKDIELD